MFVDDEQRTARIPLLLKDTFCTLESLHALVRTIAFWLQQVAPRTYSATHCNLRFVPNSTTIEMGGFVYKRFASNFQPRSPFYFFHFMKGTEVVLAGDNLYRLSTPTIIRYRKSLVSIGLPICSTSPALSTSFRIFIDCELFLVIFDTPISSFPPSV
jgi:hypothetical protein